MLSTPELGAQVFQPGIIISVTTVLQAALERRRDIRAGENPAKMPPRGPAAGLSQLPLRRHLQISINIIVPDHFKSLAEYPPPWIR